MLLLASANSSMHMFSTDSTPAGCEECVWVWLRRGVSAGVFMFMSRERPCVTCLSLSNNLFGCVIGRNGLRWAFNLISAMKKRLKIDSDGQKETGLSDIHLLSWVRQHLLPLLPLTPTQRFPFVIQTYTMLHHVSGVSIFLLTMMMFSNLADVFI